MKYELVALRFKEIMALRNLSQQELSNRSGVGKSSISHYVNGDNCPGNIIAFKLSNVLHVQPEWLMGFDVPMIKEDLNSFGTRDGELLIKIHQLSSRDRIIIENMIDNMLVKAD